MEFIAQELDISGGEHVLDVGCGWGSLLLFWPNVFPAEAGVTPAPKQVDYVRKSFESGLTDLIGLMKLIFKT